jgi:hypothetical protein
MPQDQVDKLNAPEQNNKPEHGDPWGVFFNYGQATLLTLSMFFVKPSLFQEINGMSIRIFLQETPAEALLLEEFPCSLWLDASLAPAVPVYRKLPPKRCCWWSFHVRCGRMPLPLRRTMISKIAI